MLLNKIKNAEVFVGAVAQNSKKGGFIFGFQETRASCRVKLKPAPGVA